MAENYRDGLSHNSDHRSKLKWAGVLALSSNILKWLARSEASLRESQLLQKVAEGFGKLGTTPEYSG